ncbi:MAG: hypothetical protein JXK05_00805 [Campylobacterales bacterium]|nr:hypothetical protein [Campylobacterales bacterium]
MIFELRIGWASHQTYIRAFLDDFFSQQGVYTNISQTHEAIVIEADADDTAFAQALATLESVLPYSFFMGSVTHRVKEGSFVCRSNQPKASPPLNLGLCPRCETTLRQSRDALKHCDFCGPRYTLSLMGARPVIDDAYIRRAADALLGGASVYLDTLFGVRTLSLPEHAQGEGYLLYGALEHLGRDFALTADERAALLSIERPLMQLATQSEAMQERFGNVLWVKCVDEAVGMLLFDALEGVDALWCSNARASLHVSFAPHIPTQKELHVALYQEVRLIIKGERVWTPCAVQRPHDTLIYTDTLCAVREGEAHRIDATERFTQAKTSKVLMLEGSLEVPPHANTQTFSAAQGALRAALWTHGFSGQSSVGLYFEGDDLSFYFDNTLHVTQVIPSIAFEPQMLIERLRSLREGSNRLMARLEHEDGALWAILQRIEQEGLGLFDAAALVCGLADARALEREALKFSGKGGIKVDCTLGEDHRFHPYALLGSLLSYRVAEVDRVLLCYSLYESLADYAASTLLELKSRAKAAHIVLTGASGAQASFFSRLHSKCAPLYAKGVPIGSDSAVLGALTL